MRFVLLVTGPAYGTQQASSAFQFANALLDLGHQLDCVFFYRDGVANANQFTVPASDETHLVDDWQRLGQQHGVTLLVCVTAALRRGIIDVTQAQQLQLPASNLQTGFTLAGLGELAQAALRCDRLIQF